MTNPTLERAKVAVGDVAATTVDDVRHVLSERAIEDVIRAVLMAVRSDMLDPKSGRVFDRSAASSLSAILAEGE